MKWNKNAAKGPAALWYCRTEGCKDECPIPPPPLQLHFETKCHRTESMFRQMPHVLSAFVRTLWSRNPLARQKARRRRSTPLLLVIVSKRDLRWSCLSSVAILGSYKHCIICRKHLFFLAFFLFFCHSSTLLHHQNSSNISHLIFSHP